MNRLREALFEDLARHLVLWRDSLVEAVADPKGATWCENREAAERLHSLNFSDPQLEDLRQLAGECFSGLLHSTFVTFDGGTALAETGAVSLIDASTGEPLTEDGLHEQFSDYLASKGLL